jgi:hypothetical protein
VLTLFAVSPVLALDGDEMMGDINRARETSVEGTNPNDMPKLNKDLRNERLPENITILEEKYALRNALDTMRALSKKLEDLI